MPHDYLLQEHAWPLGHGRRVPGVSGVPDSGLLGKAADVTLRVVRSFALSLPDATEEPHFDFDSYRVRGKIVVTVPQAGTHIHVFVAADTLADTRASHPECAEELRWGKKIVGVRVEFAAVPVERVKELVHAAWMRKAPASSRRKGESGCA